MKVMLFLKSLYNYNMIQCNNIAHIFALIMCTIISTTHRCIRGDVKIASSIYQISSISVGNLTKAYILLIFKPLQRISDCCLHLTKRHYQV